MVRNEGYQALSDLIYKGFLLTGLNLAGNFFVFKTINDREYKLIKLYSGFEEDNKTYMNRFNINYIIFSLFLSDGENILIRREDKYKEILEFFNNVPNILCNVVLENLMALREIASEAIEFIEGFSYTDRSRRIWKHCNGYPSREEFTGIPGTNNIGLNVFQENWILINKMLDSEEEYNKDFSRSLFVASASNPKGVRSVRAKFDSNIKLAEKRRKRISKLGSLKKREWTPEQWSAPVDTAEELVAEMMRQISGKKDRHDKFIEKHMDKIRKRAEEKTRKVEKKLEEIRSKRGAGLPLSVTQRPLTQEETEKLESRKPNNLIIVNDAREEKQKAEDRIYKKIGSKVLTGRK